MDVPSAMEIDGLVVGAIGSDFTCADREEASSPAISRAVNASCHGAKRSPQLDVTWFILLSVTLAFVEKVHGAALGTILKFTEAWLKGPLFASGPIASMDTYLRPTMNA